VVPQSSSESSTHSTSPSMPVRSAYIMITMPLNVFLQLTVKSRKAL
jgi:hypothetical protein